jgi:hypothetical protein
MMRQRVPGSKPPLGGSDSLLLSGERVAIFTISFSGRTIRASLLSPKIQTKSPNCVFFGKTDHEEKFWAVEKEIEEREVSCATKTL